MDTYIIAAVKPWNVAAFHRRTPSLPGTWRLVTRAAGLSPGSVLQLAPRFIFFPHWSWKVSREILSAAECVGFHMTDLPYGRGGSPLQNLIARGHKETKLSALRLTPELDAGPIYLKRRLSLDGRAQEIFERAADAVYDMIEEIVRKEPRPRAQRGSPTIFGRRKPHQSAIPASGSPAKLYDHIRMLDAETYPPAFLDHGSFRLTFSHAELAADGAVKATVRIARKPRKRK